MNKNLIISLVAILVLGVGYYLWSSNKSTTDTKPTSTTEKTTTPETNPDNGTETTTPPSSIGSSTTTPTTGSTPPVGELTKRGDCVPDIEKHLTTFAEKIEAQNVAYNETPLSDCSGIFLRLMKHMESTCPDFIFPDTIHRSTTQLGNWFSENNNFTIVNDIKNHANKIIPGAVIFYGHRDVVYDNLTIEKLISDNGIEHIGVVTDVTMQDGVVTKYSLFHGRTYEKNAARTRYHTNQEKTKEGNFYPAYGNGRQAIVGIGYVTTTKPVN